MADGILVGNLELSGTVDTLTLRYHKNGNYGHSEVMPGEFPSQYGTISRSGNHEKILAALSELSGQPRTCTFILNPENIR